MSLLRKWLQHISPCVVVASTINGQSSNIHWYLYNNKIDYFPIPIYLIRDLLWFDWTIINRFCARFERTTVACAVCTVQLKWMEPFYLFSFFRISLSTKWNGLNVEWNQRVLSECGNSCLRLFSSRLTSDSRCLRWIFSICESLLPNLPGEKLKIFHISERIGRSRTVWYVVCTNNFVIYPAFTWLKPHWSRIFG